MYRTLIVALLFLSNILFAGCRFGEGGKISSAEDESVINDIEHVVVHNDYSQAISFEELPSRLQGQSGYGLGFVRAEDR
jgi:hypothetical protein